MIDFSREVNSQLDRKYLRTYKFLQLIIVLFFLGGGLYFSYLVMFPSQNFFFDFNNPNAKKNSIKNVLNKDGQLPKKGIIPSQEEFSFNAFLAEPFSRVKINFLLDKKSASIESGDVSLRKTFKAFSYPISDSPLKIKDSSLVKNNGAYYIVSDGKLRKFPSLDVLQALGYKAESFAEISDEELSLNEQGEIISATPDHPSDSLFNIEGDFYRLKDKTLLQFVSESAYHTHHESNQAIKKNKDFLKKYEISGNLLGFSDGTLLSFGNSVFIVENEKIFPIDNETTVISMDFNWNDVIPVNEEEVGIYEKGKLFTLSDPHPQGTIFATREEGRYYRVGNGELQEIKNNYLLRSYLRNNPILVSNKGLDISKSCHLEQKFSFFNNQYQCSVSINELLSLSGNNYQFTTKLGPTIQIDTINTTFFREASKSNLFLSFADFKKKILTNFYGQPQ